LISHLSGLQIDEIWTWEATQHGDSALINKDNLTGICELVCGLLGYMLTVIMIIIDDWMDNSRDILNFLLNYLPSAAAPFALPTHLPRVSWVESESRKVNGYKDRTLAAVGHSFGGCTT
jgi:hypothetical protein